MASNLSLFDLTGQGPMVAALRTMAMGDFESVEFGMEAHFAFVAKSGVLRGDELFSTEVVGHGGARCAWFAESESSGSGSTRASSAPQT